MKKLLFSIAITAAVISCNNAEPKDTSEKPAADKAAQTASNAEELLNKEWILKELNGAEILLDTTFPQYPYVKFESLTEVGGNLGCNGFGGNLVISAPDSINISQIRSTKMACPNLEIENRFAAALENASTYKVEGNTLLLTNNKKEMIVKLETAQ